MSKDYVGRTLVFVALWVLVLAGAVYVIQLSREPCLSIEFLPTGAHQ